MSTQTVLITGASTGFGRLTAELLARAGHTVYATMRGVEGKNKAHADEIRDLAAKERLSLRVLELDVTDEAQVRHAVGTVIAEAGGIDVLVNNAGIAGASPLEGFTTDQARFMYETNVFGPISLIRAALPQMREQRSGLIINVTSGVGRFTLPGFGLYSSTKWALEALGESLRYELAPLGVDSVVVEPGAFKTEIQGKFVEPNDPGRNEDYARAGSDGSNFVGALESYFASDAYRGPEAVAEAIAKVIDTPFGSRPLRVPVGADLEAVHRINEATEPIQRDVLRQFGFEPTAAVS